MRELTMIDRFGIGWRPELAAGILSNLHDIDVVEVIAEDYLSVPRSKIRALRTLSQQVPVVLHGVSLGMASAVPAVVGQSAKLLRRHHAVAGNEWW